MNLQDFCARVAANYRVAGDMSYDAVTGEWVNHTEYCGRLLDDYRLICGLAVLEQAEVEQY